MRTIKKIKSILLSTAVLLGLTGCGFIDIDWIFGSDSESESSEISSEDISTGPVEEVINIASLSGEVIKTEAAPAVRQVKRANSNGETSESISDVEVSESEEILTDVSEEVIEPLPEAQYVIMYKSEQEIKFTIKLDNPKGAAIDAVELTCDDLASQIMVDGEYKPIHDESAGRTSRVVNWAQEDPYEKVYNIRTTSEESIQTLRVLDLKVNGVWQGKELDKNELKIYKMEDTDLLFEYKYNKFDEYGFEIKSSDAISNIEFISTNVIVDGSIGKVIEEGTVKYSYTYKVAETELRWEDEFEIEFVKIKHNIWWPDMQDRDSINFVIIGGTNVNSFIEYSLDNRVTWRYCEKTFMASSNPDTFGYYAPGVRNDSTVYVRFGNTEYLLDNLVNK